MSISSSRICAGKNAEAILIWKTQSAQFKENLLA